MYLINETQQKIFAQLLNLTKYTGDILHAGNGSHLFKKLFNLNDFIMGFGGFVSGVISCYQMY